MECKEREIQVINKEKEFRINLTASYGFQMVLFRKTIKQRGSLFNNFTE